VPVVTGCPCRAWEGGPPWIETAQGTSGSILNLERLALLTASFYYPANAIIRALAQLPIFQNHPCSSNDAGCERVQNILH
jgi:hypothetical protein